MPKNILILGAGGNFNQVLVPELIHDGYNVRAFDLIELNYDCQCIVGSVRDFDCVHKACEGIDTIIHAAGLHNTLPRSTKHPEAYEDFWQTNIHGTHVVYRAALEQGIRKVVFLSSISYYAPGPGYYDEDWPASRPAHNYYDLSKVLSEDIARLYSAGHGIESIVLRPGNFTGLPEPGFDFLGGRLRREDVAQAARLSIDYDPGDEKFQPFNILAGNPFGPEDFEDLQSRPLDALEKYYPGIKDFMKTKGLTWTGLTRVPSIKRAREQLNYNPQFTFETYLRDIAFSKR
jgi:nucleoside-diphosphate-sugar epimerase